MDLGFETIGNATLILHDRGPVLATDPWLKGSAYFGSWTTSHEIPDEQLEHVKACPYLWISHGHPDHLSPESLEDLRDKEILLPDHYGGRVRRGLTDDGYRVRLLKCGQWTRLSERLRVCCIADMYQDAVLIVDLGGHLIVNSNDAGDNGAGPFVRRLAQDYDSSFLLALTGYGDADMVNFFDEEGRRIEPPAMRREPFGEGLANILEAFGIRYYIPFAAQHKYQRTDSAWANACTTPSGAHSIGFQSEMSSVLPAFMRCDLARDSFEPIGPARRPDKLYEPETFGDNWSDELQPGERDKLAAYLAPVSHLKSFLGWVNFRVGGQDNVIDVNRANFERGVTFEVPRQSLMTAVEYQVFDDIMIGNFARTILHGDWERSGTEALYPDLIPYLCKFADNGDARSPAELRAYFAEYQRRGFFGFPAHALGQLAAGSIGRYLEHAPLGS